MEQKNEGSDLIAFISPPGNAIERRMKMKAYEVTALHLVRCTYTVDANSMEEAIKNVDPSKHKNKL